MGMKIVIWVIALASLLISLYNFKAMHGNPYKEVLWGKEYKRRRITTKGEVQRLTISQSGDGYLEVLIPSVRGSASIPLSEKNLEIFAAKIQNQESGLNLPLKVLLILMQPSKKTYVVKLPQGKKLFLGNATILSEKAAANEYDYDELEKVEEKIKPVLYNRNALLICAAVCLFFNPIVSVICSAISMYITRQNQLFSDFPSDAWTSVDTSSYPQPTDSITLEDTRILSKAEQTIKKVKEEIPKYAVACKICGSILESDNWQFCPHCGMAIISVADIHNTEEPDDETEEISGEDIQEIEDIFDNEDAETLDSDSLMDEPNEEFFDPGEGIDDLENGEPDEESDESPKDDISLLDVDELPDPQDFRGMNVDGVIDADYRILSQ